MNFEKAYKELLAGKKIRRKEWDPFTHLRLIDGVLKTFESEVTSFYTDVGVLITDGWTVVDGDGMQLSFIDALEALKQKKCITREAMGDAFIFIDNDGQFATCRPVAYHFMPTFKCLCSTDWEIMK